MFYRVTADILFTIDDEATDFFHDCELALAKGTVINLELPNEEMSHILLQMCFHDENPSIPCQTLKEGTILSP